MAHSLDRVLSLALEPWALTRPMLTIVAQVLGRRIVRAGEWDGSGLIVAPSAAFDRREQVAPARTNGIAVIPIHGVIAPRMTALSDISGGATFEQALGALDEALAETSVGTIVFDIDSPGGSVAGATEFAAAVRAARERKHIVAHANFLMCSAAYWLAAQAHEVIASPSSTVGSIGVYAIHEDLSAALEELGVKLTIIAAGKYKVETLDGQPLGEVGRANLESHVTAHYDHFVADVAAGRGVAIDAVTNGYGQGLALTAADALAAGLVDRIETFDATLARLGAAPATAPTITVIPAAALAAQQAQTRELLASLQTLGVS